jgi:regulator of protease activity HflC (stomatin/prohibitin superfamily)
VDQNSDPPPQVAKQKLELKKNDLKGGMIQFVNAQQNTNAQANQAIQELEATSNQAIQRLEVQVGQMAKELSKGERDKIPTPNPRGHKQLKVVTSLKSGKSVDHKVRIDETIQASPAEATTSKVSEKEKVTAPFFPQRLVKPKKEKKLLNIFETSRKVEIYAISLLNP